MKAQVGSQKRKSASAFKDFKVGADLCSMGRNGPGDYSSRKLRRLGVLVGTIAASALALAIAGFWWWPMSLIGLPLMLVVWRETDPGGVLDPLPHIKGKRGEESIGDILGQLGDQYRVHHGIDTGRGNVDHVVIGPTGIFAIETKNIAGRFERRHERITHNGYDASGILKQARAEGMAIRDRLREAGVDRWVEAVVASVEAEVVGDRLEEGNVAVVSVQTVRPFIVNRRVRLSPSDVDAAESAIVQSVARP